MGGSGGSKSDYIPYFKSVALILEARNLARRYVDMERF